MNNLITRVFNVQRRLISSLGRGLEPTERHIHYLEDITSQHDIMVQYLKNHNTTI